jgi:protein-S-isoprenylcysteine O-methyltransferase Ste14
MSVIILLVSIAIWGALHSFQASLFLKSRVQSWFGPAAMRFYRLAYNLFAVLSFAPIIWLVLKLPDQPLYRVPAPWSYILLLGQALAALMLLIGVFQTDILSFMGLRQVFEGERRSALVTEGLYKYVRHPLYTAGLLMIWLAPAASINSLTVFLGLTAYILLGAWFEERKLLREFGEAYAEYQMRTPMLFPHFSFKNRGKSP